MQWLDSRFEDAERNRRGTADNSNLRTGTWLFPQRGEPDWASENAQTFWHATLRRAKVACFRIYDLRSTYATLVSSGGDTEGPN